MKKLIFFLFISGCAYAQTCVTGAFATTPNLAFKLPFYNQCNWGAQGYNPNFTAIDTMFPSGVLAKANGGTGTATPALVAGTNVTITGAWPNQTINSSGGGAVTTVFGMTGAIANLSGDVTTSGSSATTLATVNSNVGSFTSANVTVDAKGRITAAANGSSGGSVTSGTAGQAAVYGATGTTVIGSSAVFTISSGTAGTTWTDKVVTAYTALGAGGGTIVVPDSIADNGAATTPSIPTNVTLQFPGSATFTMCNMTLGPNTKIYATGGALLQFSGSSCGLSETATSTDFQTIDKFVIKGLRINCNSQTTSTGLAIGNDAQVKLEDVSIGNCTTAGMRLNATQFGQFVNMNVFNSAVGIKIYTIVGQGGGNSNTFYDLKLGSDPVGMIIADQPGAGFGGETTNVLINPTFIGCSVAGLAVFGNVTQADVHIYGGAPEANASGAASVTIDGLLIKRASIYGNLARVSLKDVPVAEASADPVFLMENFSVLTADNVSGYGSQYGTLFSADATSFVSFTGDAVSSGEAIHVVGWPSNVTGGRGAMAGSPISYLNSAAPQSYAGNPLTPPFSSTTGTTSNAMATDAVYGTVNTVTFAASAGSSASNQVQIADVIPVTAGGHDDLFSVLLKSSATGTFRVFLQESGGGAGFLFQNNFLTLQAGIWTRVIGYNYNLPDSTGAYLQIYPMDSVGATVSITRVVGLSAVTGSTAGDTGQASAWARSQVLQGAVNPNNGNCSAVGTAASPSVASCGVASQGNFSCATNASTATCTVNTTRVTANSQIWVQEDETQGTKLGVTCNTGTTVIPTSRLLASKVAGTSFTINLGTVTTNPACFSYRIDN